LAVATDGQSGLDLLDKDGIPRASMIVATNGAPTLRLADQHLARVGLDVTPDGLPGLALLGADGKTRASVTLNADGTGAFTLFDATGNTSNSVP
ncbi:hypothetical protein, partial [Rhodoblastus sp.]|uniref:hypothetical protein n=1 Tax=Rhodoblastus sp. TaxID=1962975 RepID=UPI003F9EAF4D